MTIAVTGAAGFVGRATVRELARQGQHVLAVVRPGRDLPAELEGPSIDVVRADLRRPTPELLDRLEGADAIVHLAAAMSGTPRDRFDATVLATERLLAELADRDWAGRFVHVSSLAVYGFNQLPRRATLDEGAPLEPDLGRRDEYAWTKAWQERVVTEAAGRGLDVCIVRPGAIYGPDRPFQQRLGRLVGGRWLLLFGGLNRMPLAFVDNVASLLATCAVHPGAGAGQVFHAIDPDPPRQLTYVRGLRRRQRTLRVVPVPGPVFRGVGKAYALAGRWTDGSITAPGIVEPYINVPNYAPFRFDGTKPGRLLGWTPPVDRRGAFAQTFGGLRG